MRRMVNLNFYNLMCLIQQLMKEFHVISYSFNISGMNGTFWLVTTCKVIQDSLDSFAQILDTTPQIADSRYWYWILMELGFRIPIVSGIFLDSLICSFRTLEPLIPDCTSEKLPDSRFQKQNLTGLRYPNKGEDQDRLIAGWRGTVSGQPFTN